MVTKIIALIKERKLISLSDLAVHFEMDKSALIPLLNNLVNKGYIKHINAECDSCSNDCSKCSFVKDTDYYQPV